MTTVTTYKSNSVNISDICNTANSNYYGNITTGYQQSGTDVGSILAQKTFSTVDGTITPCGYKANIVQYNTGSQSNWSKVHTFSTSLSATAICTSTSGKYCIVVRGTSTDIGQIYYSTNYGDTWKQTLATSVYFRGRTIAISGDGTTALVAGATSAGGGQYIYYSTNYGETWNQSTFINLPIGKICLSNNFTSVIYTSNSVSDRIFFSTNDQTFQNLSNINLFFKVLGMSSSGEICVGAERRTNLDDLIMYISYDYGNNWENKQTSLGNEPLSIAISASGQYMLIATTPGFNGSTSGLYYSSDYGTTFTKSDTTIPGSNFYSLSMSATGQYAIGTNSNAVSGSYDVYSSSDYGKTWSSFNVLLNDAGAGYVSTQSICISGNGLYAFFISGKYICRSVNTSTTMVSKDLTEVFEPLYKYKLWSIKNVLSGTQTNTGNWSAISMSYSGRYIFIANRGWALFSSSDYGVTFTERAVTDKNIICVSISRSGKYGVLCTNTSNTNNITNNIPTGTGVINYTSDNGVTWREVTTPGSLIFTCVSISPGGKYAIAGVNGGRIWYSSNFGQTFTQSSTILTLKWITMSMSATKYAVACDNYGYIYISSNYGSTWTRPSGSVSSAWSSVSMSNSGQYAIACIGYANNGIYYSNDYGVNWIESPNTKASNGWVSVSISSTGQYAIAAAYNGSLYYSYNYGVDWTISLLSSNYLWKSISMSGNSKYAMAAINVTNSGNVYSCLPTN